MKTMTIGASVALLLVLAEVPAAGKDFQAGKGQPFQVTLFVTAPSTPPVSNTLSDPIVFGPDRTAILEFAACSASGPALSLLVHTVELVADRFENGTKIDTQTLLTAEQFEVVNFLSIPRYVSNDQFFACLGPSCPGLDGTTYDSLALRFSTDDSGSARCLVSGWLF